MVRSAMECGHGQGPKRRLNRFCQLVALLTFLVFATALAQSATDVQHRDNFGLFRHIRTTDPGRPNGPLRQDNITDEEVREVQRAALEVFPDFIVSISGVTDGCDCEDGSNCTAQVWLALYRENQTRSLVLSKIDGHWKIGAVQSWWLQYSAHQSTNPGFGRGPRQIAWAQENQRLLDSFPTCPIAPVDWMLVSNESHGSTYVDMSSIQVSRFVRRVNFKRVLPPPPKKYWPSTLFFISLIAFDCKDHRMRIDEQDSYYDDGTARKSPGYTDPVLWDPIRPKTDSAADLELICAWNGK
jgi:surface-adhesin protein E